jgi:hypothetical protein
MVQSSAHNITLCSSRRQRRTRGACRDARGAARGAQPKRPSTHGTPIPLRGTCCQPDDVPAERMMRIMSSFDVIDGQRGSHTILVAVRNASYRKSAQELVAPDRKMEGSGISPRAPQQRFPIPPAPARGVGIRPRRFPHRQRVRIAFRQPYGHIEPLRGERLVSRGCICVSADAGISLLSPLEQGIGHRRLVAREGIEKRAMSGAERRNTSVLMWPLCAAPMDSAARWRDLRIYSILHHAPLRMGRMRILRVIASPRRPRLLARACRRGGRRRR